MEELLVIFTLLEIFVTKRYLFCFKRINNFHFSVTFTPSAKSDGILDREPLTRLNIASVSFSLLSRTTGKTRSGFTWILGNRFRRLYVERDEAHFLTILIKSHQFPLISHV